MRRWLTAGACAATLALAGGCGAGGHAATGARPARNVPAPSSPSAWPSAPRSADAVEANTHQVCGTINRAVAAGATAFGTDLGSMVGHLAGANPAAAGKAKSSALHQLTALAATVRSAAAPALDSGVRAAAENTAGSLERIAADPALLAGVRTTADVVPVLTRVTATTDPLTNVCA